MKKGHEFDPHFDIGNIIILQSLCQNQCWVVRYLIWPASIAGSGSDYLEPNQNWVWFLEWESELGIKLNLVWESELEQQLGSRTGTRIKTNFFWKTNLEEKWSGNGVKFGHDLLKNQNRRFLIKGKNHPTLVTLLKSTFLG
jgi:hypothetical protein